MRQHDGVKIMPEHYSRDNSLPIFMKQFIINELNGKIVVIED